MQVATKSQPFGLNYYRYKHKETTPNLLQVISTRMFPCYYYLVLLCFYNHEITTRYKLWNGWQGWGSRIGLGAEHGRVKIVGSRDRIECNGIVLGRG